MSILFVIDDYLPESRKSGAQMVHDLACYLINAGHRVSVLTPTYQKKDKPQRGDLDGVRLYHFCSGKTKNVNRIRRAINETLLSWRAYKALRNVLKSDPHDLIVYYSPSIFWGPLILYLRHIWKCPAYLILRDIFPQWAVDRGLISKYSPVYGYFKLFEMISYKAADRIGVQSPGNRKYFDKHSKKMKDKVEVLYNWAPTSKPDRTDRSWRKKLGLDDKVLCFFGGNIGHAQDMMNIVRLAENMKHLCHVHFLLVGEGDEVNLVKREKNIRNLDNITHISALPMREYFGILEEVDIGLFSLHCGHRTHNIPGKLLGYMQFGVPILGSVNAGNDIREIIEKSEAGLISVNGDDDAFKTNAIRLLENRKMRERMGENGKRLLTEYFSVEKASKQVMEIKKKIRKENMSIKIS